MTQPRLRGAVVVLVITAAVAGWPAAAPSQITLEDAVVRSFEITADLRPEPFMAVCEQRPAVLREPPVCRITRFGTLRGRTVARLEVTGGSPLSTLRMFLDPDLTIRSIDGPPHLVRREGFYTVLVFNPALPAGSTATLTFEYEGRTWFVWDDLIFVDTGYLYPQVISPFGDLSVNRATIRTGVTVPAGYLLASTGRVQRTESGGNQTYTWEVAEPLPYLGVVGGKVFRAVDRKAGTLDLQILVRPQADRFTGQIADFALKAAEFYGRLIYPFPFDRLTVIAEPLGLGVLGRGYPGLMVLLEEAFTGRRGSDLDRDSFRLLLVAHEAAHTYVPAQTSPRGVGYAWLSEGFAEYLGLMTVQVVMGPQAFRRELDEDRRWYARVAGRDRPIAAYTRINNNTAEAVAVRYAKGAFVLHMLRFVVGDETFQRVLSTYFTRFRAQSARVDDFARVAAEVAGTDLTWFFQQWVHDLVLPDYAVSEVTAAPADGGGFRITARVRNLGSGTMPVEVLFELDTGERVVQRVQVGSRADAAVTVHAPRPARRVEVDPEKWILQRNYTNDVWTR